jgi:hypothetical protein
MGLGIRVVSPGVKVGGAILSAVGETPGVTATVGIGSCPKTLVNPKSGTNKKNINTERRFISFSRSKVILMDEWRGQWGSS